MMTQLGPNSWLKPARPFFLAGALCGSVVFLAACLEDSLASADSAGSPSKEMQALLEAAETGRSQITFAGAVTTTGDYTTGEAGRYAGASANIFQPALGGRAEHSRRGSNADGPYMFSIYTDAIHQNDEDDFVRAWITVILPEGAGPGRYGVAANADAEENEAQASLIGDGYAWRFDRNIEGELHISELGEVLTAAWAFTTHDRAGNAVDVSGAVKDLAFTPQQEASFTLTANGERVEHFGRLTSQRRNDGRHNLLLGPGVYLELPAGADSGTLPIRKSRQSDDDATVTFPDYQFDEAEGELTLELVIGHDGNYLRGNYSLSTLGGDAIELEGSFDHVEASDS